MEHATQEDLLHIGLGLGLLIYFLAFHYFPRFTMAIVLTATSALFILGLVPFFVPGIVIGYWIGWWIRKHFKDKKVVAA